ncbi:MAG TPA: phospholipase D-like domain-containing protein [Candidatus Polarisedimenticolia bacterium]|jgi:cardiolipin synthase|nr:phospholipase D-like domain-containing protein [Candidatus Polarisedimenticolia bacterium]
MTRRLPSILVLAAVLAQGGCAILPHFAGQRNQYQFQPPFPVEDPQFRRSLDNIGGVIVGGNSAVLLENGDGFFPAMLKDIREAKVSVNLEAFIYKPDEVGRQFADAMIEASRRGVEVRLMVDAQGSKLGSLRKELEAAGVICRDYRPASRYPIFGRRTHRKLLVIDGKIAYTGGFCFEKRWLGNARDKTEIHDSAVRVTGLVVSQMQAVFCEDWTFTTGEILAGDVFYPKTAPAGSMESQAVKTSKGDASSLPKMLYFMAIQAARKSIHIQNSYFLPDRQIRKALIAAANRGVDVKVIVPGRHIDFPPVRLASRFHYGPLLQGGVKIYEYRPSMIHSKTLIVDGIFSTIGSINLDVRSMSKNAEVSLSFYDRSFSGAMEAMFQRDLKISEEITYEGWKHRGVATRFFELLSGMFEPLY